MALSGWSYRKIITIDSSEVDNTHINLIVKIKLSASNFNFNLARSDGYDIRFTDSDEDTLLLYQRQFHSVSLQEALYYVRLPLVSPNNDVIFYMYYGKPDASNGSTVVAYGGAKPKLIFNALQWQRFRDDDTDMNDFTYPLGLYNLKIDANWKLNIGNGYHLIIG